MQTIAPNLCSRCLTLLNHKSLVLTHVTASFSLESIKKGKQKTHYDILGLQHEASAADIRAAFVKISKEIHPDKNHGNPSNHVKFVALNEAYTVLSKPTTRREYDIRLMAATLQQQHHSSHGTTGPTYNSSEFYRDETIWNMRDRSKYTHAHYGSDNYYGIRGVRRKSNGYVAALCTGLIGIGCLIFAGVFKLSHDRMRGMLDARDRRSLGYLNEAQERAKMNGKEAQLERFRLSVQQAEDRNKFDRSSSK